MGASRSPVKSSTDPPARPNSIAAEMVAATPPGSWAKQFSRSAETGMSTAPASSPACARTSSLLMAPSRRPRVAANPPLVVAIASKPSEANKAADPMSQALGMRSGVPGVCKARNCSARSVSLIAAPYREDASVGLCGPGKFPVLELDRHGQEVGDIDRVDLDHTLVVHVQVDELHAVVGLTEGLSAFLHAAQLVERADGEAVVVHTGALHRVVLGDEEDELIPVDAAHDEPAPVLGHHFHFGEAEHLVEEAAHVGPVRGIEQVGRQRHRHVVEARIAGWVEGMGHEGTTMTLPAMRPAASASSVSPMALSPTSPGSISRSDGKPSEASSSSARSKPPWS